MTGVLETVFLVLAVRENNAHVVGRRKLAAAPNRSHRGSDRLRIKACNTKTLSEDSTEAILVKVRKKRKKKEGKKMRSNGYDNQDDIGREKYADRA